MKLSPLPPFLHASRPLAERTGVVRLIAVMLMGALSVGCASKAVVAPASPSASEPSRLLQAAAPPTARSERLQASVQLFGIPLAELQSDICSRDSGAASVHTRVVANSVFRALRSGSGEARTELLAGLHEPLVSDYRFVEGDVLRHYEVSHQPGRYQYVYDNGGRASRKGRIQVPEGAYPHDMHSAMALIRGWEPSLDERAHFFAVLGRRLWRVELHARGPEVLKLGGGARLSRRIEGRAVRLWKSQKVPRERVFTVWVSDDPARVPLHMTAETSIGDVRLSLEDHALNPAACAPDEAARLVRNAAP